MSTQEASPLPDPLVGISTAQWSTSLQWAVGRKKKFKKTRGRRWRLSSLARGLFIWELGESIGQGLGTERECYCLL